MRYVLVLVASMLLFPVGSAQAQVSIGIGVNTPGISLGIHIGGYPRLVRIPGYPVYYDPYVQANYFFYDGLYWVFYSDNWYVSSWYNGPWQLVGPYEVPLFILRIPVRYYRHPPVYFRGWPANAPPRWDKHWGPEWERHHKDWNRWDRRTAPAPAPLPRYQKEYSGKRYPSQREQQRPIRTDKYRYTPREPVTREYYKGTRTDQRRTPAKKDQGRTPDKDRKDRRDDRDQQRR